MSWQDSANCRGADPDLFFPERGYKSGEAKQLCAWCKVRAQCLDDAMEQTNCERLDYGIRGGLTVKERQALRRVST